jgi:hypothetical protein
MWGFLQVANFAAPLSEAIVPVVIVCVLNKLMSDDELELESTLNEHHCEEQDLQINSSAIVKSHFLTLDLSRRRLRSVPTLLPRTERLIAVDNML